MPGTRLTLSVSGLVGPQTSRIVVVDRQMRRETLATIQVPSIGYGTATQRMPLQLQLLTPTTRGGVVNVDVECAEPDGGWTRLVRLTISRTAGDRGSK